MIYIQNNNIYYNYIMCNKNKIEKKKKKKKKKSKSYKKSMEII